MLLHMSATKTEIYYLCSLAGIVAAEGLEFGNGVYWICFDEEYAEKVNFFLFFQSLLLMVLLILVWSLILYHGVLI